MERTDRDVDDFLAGLPDDIRDDMVDLDRLITDVMADHPRELWDGKLWGGTRQEIVGYGRQTYLRSDKQQVEWFLVGLARQKDYLSVYVSAVEDGRYLAEAHGPHLGKVKVGKSSISFASLDDIDRTALRALLERARDVSATS